MDEAVGFHPRDEFEIREESIGPTILLASGAYFSFEHPERTPLPVEDIAHALSHICRFTGHCREFYSVAQHAVLTSYLAPPEFAFHALHHDDVEAVLGDMSSPLKRLIPQYKAIERRIEAVILAQFGLPAEMPPEVKRADLVALRTEQRDLMHKAGGLWKSLDGIEPSNRFRVLPLSPEQAATQYLRRHRELLELAELREAMRAREIDAAASRVVAGLTAEQVTAIHSLPYVRDCLLSYHHRPVDETADAVVKAIAAQVTALAQPSAATIDAAAALRAEEFIQAAISNSPEPLRELGDHLSRVLDEDEWKTAERYLLAASVVAGSKP